MDPKQLEDAVNEALVHMYNSSQFFVEACCVRFGWRQPTQENIALMVNAWVTALATYRALIEEEAKKNGVHLASIHGPNSQPWREIDEVVKLESWLRLPTKEEGGRGETH